MAIRDKMRANAQPHVYPGEQIQVVFGAQTHSSYWIPLLFFIFFSMNRYRTVVVTDHRILLCESTTSMTHINRVLWELPRTTVIGPATGLWFKCNTLGERLYIHKRFHKDIAQADAMVARPY
jgi:hypothetical protein